MKRIAFLLATACAALPGGAQQPADDAAERARISAGRRQAEAEFEEAHKACYRKFAVNDCIGEAKVRRREVLAQLRRQELALNEVERQRKSEERLRDLAQREAEQRERTATPPAAPASAAQEQGGREAAQAASPASRPASAAAPARAARAPRTPNTPPQPDTQANQRRHDQRVQQAQEHKARIEKKAAESTRKDVRPLPVPP
ncbi:hypothetical protein [Ramlibacter sp. Leaf400]|uniref:hypothetical protein n=1 Tax=Ramlibacter sp. Leaf400 TaxID=1736365 RepID=UPI0006FCF6B4|nr:hypothetical protein [Ramlibacter sp. Leaf400]KQT10625.1 hypothetical protein ASG30_07350 [Ramlibacter sp. Leaf400]